VWDIGGGGDVAPLPPPPQDTANSVTNDIAHTEPIPLTNFRRFPENGKKIRPLTNNQPEAKTLVPKGRNAAEPVRGPVVVIESVVVTTRPLVLSVGGVKLQLASAGKPEQLSEIALLELKPVKGVIANTNEAGCPAPTVALVLLEEIASEAEDVRLC